MKHDSTQPFEVLIQLIQLQDTTLIETISNFSDANWSQRCGESNPAFWIVGHLTANRRETFREIGGQMKLEPWETLFHDGHATLPLEMNGQYLVEDFLTLGMLLINQIRQIPLESKEKEIDMAWLPVNNTIEGYLMFRFWHETYHIGQLTLMRKALTKNQY